MFNKKPKPMYKSPMYKPLPTNKQEIKRENIQIIPQPQPITKEMIEEWAERKIRILEKIGYIVPISPLVPIVPQVSHTLDKKLPKVVENSQQQHCLVKSEEQEQKGERSSRSEVHSHSGNPPQPQPIIHIHNYNYYRNPGEGVIHATTTKSEKSETLNNNEDSVPQYTLKGIGGISHMDLNKSYQIQSQNQDICVQTHSIPDFSQVKREIPNVNLDGNAMVGQSIPISLENIPSPEYDGVCVYGDIESEPLMVIHPHVPSKSEGSPSFPVEKSEDQMGKLEPVKTPVPVETPTIKEKITQPVDNPVLSQSRLPQPSHSSDPNAPLKPVFKSPIPQKPKPVPRPVPPSTQILQQKSSIRQNLEPKVSQERTITTPNPIPVRVSSSPDLPPFQQEHQEHQKLAYDNGLKMGEGVMPEEIIDNFKEKEEQDKLENNVQPSTTPTPSPSNQSKSLLDNVIAQIDNERKMRQQIQQKKKLK